MCFLFLSSKKGNLDKKNPIFSFFSFFISIFERYGDVIDFKGGTAGVDFYIISLEFTIRGRNLSGIENALLQTKNLIFLEGRGVEYVRPFVCPQK